MSEERVEDNAIMDEDSNPKKGRNGREKMDPYSRSHESGLGKLYIMMLYTMFLLHGQR